jgi:hypothetical protein
MLYFLKQNKNIDQVNNMFVIFVNSGFNYVAIIFGEFCFEWAAMGPIWKPGLEGLI